MKTEPSFRIKVKLIRKLTLIAAAIATAGLVTIFLVRMKETVYAQGVVRPVNHHSLTSPQDGIIQRIHLHPGEKVKAGDVLLEIYPTDLVDGIEDLKCKMAEAQAELRVSEAKLAYICKNPLPEELRNAGEEAVLKKLRYEKLVRDAKQAERLHQHKIISDSTYRDKLLERDVAKIECNKAEILRDLLAGGLAKVIIEQAKAEKELNRVKVENLQRQKKLLDAKLVACQIKAPFAGQVLHIPEQEGVSVAKDEQVVQIVWGADKMIRAEISERDIQNICGGQPVLCYSAHYDRYKTEAFKGRVSRILAEVEPNDRGRFYKVDIELETEPMSLRLGSSVDLEIITGTQTVLETLLDK